MEEEQEKKPRRQINAYAKYSGLAIQMGVIIGGLTWLGVFLDEKYNHGGKAWTLSLSLFGVFAALYLVIREVINMSKDN